MKNEIDKLIVEYQQEIEKAMKILYNKIGRQDIMRAWREKVIPACGKISEDISYELHGIGCNLVFKNYEVDFDFGPNNKIDGFDLWKIKSYAQQFPDKYPNYQDENELKKDFDTLIKSGRISQKYIGDSWLYFYN